MTFPKNPGWCECGRPAKVKISDGWICERCHRLQNELKFQERDHIKRARDWLCECGKRASNNHYDWSWHGKTWYHWHADTEESVPTKRSKPKPVINCKETLAEVRRATERRLVKKL